MTGSQENLTKSQNHPNKKDIFSKPWYRWVAYLVANLAFTSGVVVSSIGIIIPEIMRDLTIQANSVGVIISIYSYTYALIQIPAGIMADRVGPRRTMSLFLLIGASGMVLFSQAQHFNIALLGRILTALGVGVLYVNQIKILRGWFRSDEFGTAMGIGSSLNSIGSLIASPLLALLVDIYGWRSSFTWVGVMNIGFAIVVWIIIRDRNPQLTDQFRVRIDTLPTIGIWHSTKTIFSNRQFIYLFLIGSLSFGGIMGVFFSWGLAFLRQGYGLSRVHASLIMTVSSLFTLFGAPFWGWVSDKKLRARKPVLLWGLIGSTLSILPMAFMASRLNYITLIIIFAFIGFSMSGLLLVYTMVNELFPASIAGVAAAGLNMGPYIGSGIYQILAGYMLGAPASHATDGTPLYTLLNYQSIYLPGVVAGFIAIIIVTRVKETMNQDQDYEEIPSVVGTI